jgi:triphosphatase
MGVTGFGKMGKEIELKFQVRSRELRRLKDLPILHGKPSEEEDLVSVYFDTPKHKLARNGVTLRVRRRGDEFFQTIKSGGFSGSFRRGEWEHEIRGALPNLREARGTPLAPLLTKKVKRQLKPVFETRIHRTSIPVRKNRALIEVALDRGQISSGRRSTPVGELELELKRGKVSEVFKLARQITRLVPATLSLKSKSEQGYDLIEKKETGARPAEKISVRRGISTADAFRSIGRSALRQIAANRPAVENCDSEGVHQMRVGLRRIRAAISLFGELLGDKQTTRIKFELKWLTGELALAREFDVYQKNKIEPLRGVAPGKRGMKDLAGTVASRRDAAFAKAKNAVNSPRYRLLLLDTMQWLEIGGWAKHSRRYGVQPINRSASDILAKRRKRIIKKAKRLRELDARQQHKLRIAAKKMRYACDFFENLFSGHKSKKRLSEFQERLKELQDHLGALNDIRVDQKLASKLVAVTSRKTGPQEVFAAGFVTGRERAETEPLLEDAEKAADKLAQIKPLWK